MSNKREYESGIAFLQNAKMNLQMAKNMLSFYYQQTSYLDCAISDIDIAIEGIEREYGHMSEYNDNDDE